MDNQNTENNINKHIFSSSEVIDKVLNAIGLTRDALSTYQQYQYPNGDYLRLRVSNHGIFLQHWFDKNREARMDGQNVPKLDVGLNLAITFAPNEQECLAMGKPFPVKIKNVTAAKTQQSNNVKPQFKVRHICYYSWMLTQEDIDAISASLSNCVTNGDNYKEPLQGNPDKVVEWEDTSNLPPKKVEGNTLQQSKDNNKLNTEQYMNKKTIRLTESDLKQIVKESVNMVLNEAIPWEKYNDHLKKLGYKHPWNGPKNPDNTDMDGLFLIYVIPIVDGKQVIVNNGKVYITLQTNFNPYQIDQKNNWTEEFDNFDDAKKVCMEANKILGREVFSPRGVKMNKYGVRFGHSRSEARPLTDLKSHKHGNDDVEEY